MGGKGRLPRQMFSGFIPSWLHHVWQFQQIIATHRRIISLGIQNDPIYVKVVMLAPRPVKLYRRAGSDLTPCYLHIATHRRIAHHVDDHISETDFWSASSGPSL